LHKSFVIFIDILLKFNAKLFGQSYANGGVDNWKVSQLNVAIGGSMANQLPDQARDLIHRMQQHSQVVIYFVTFFLLKNSD
jgi:hypothetical protein